MISKAELKYVNKYARHVPYPGNSYAISVIEELSKAFQVYEKDYKSKEYNFIFSNGEEINFQIFTKNLAHLLGIDFKNIISEQMRETCENVLGLCNYEEKNSFDVLKRIIERADEVIKNDSNPKNKKILNYYKVMIKSIAFTKLTKFDQFNFGCINFDKSFYEQKTNTLFTPQSSKLLFTPSNEAITPYFVMGIVPEATNIYIPETIIAPENFEDFITNQTLLIPIQVLVSDNFNLNKIKATSEEKLQLLNMYKGMLIQYKTNSFIDIYNDYENILKENQEKTK